MKEEENGSILKIFRNYFISSLTVSLFSILGISTSFFYTTKSRIGNLENRVNQLEATTTRKDNIDIKLNYISNEINDIKNDIREIKNK